MLLIWVYARQLPSHIIFYVSVENLPKLNSVNPKKNKKEDSFFFFLGGQGSNGDKIIGWVFILNVRLNGHNHQCNYVGKLISYSSLCQACCNRIPERTNQTDFKSVSCKASFPLMTVSLNVVGRQWAREAGSESVGEKAPANRCPT